MRVKPAMLLCGLMLGHAQSAEAVVLSPDFIEEMVSTAATQISGIGWAPDASLRLFFLRKSGTVRIIENGVLLPTPFATLSPIFTNSECGLIGMTFDPDFITNGFVYFFVTVSNTEQHIIRYRAEGNIGVEPTIIVSGLPTRGVNHDGGAIGFGPDGHLYWAIGDNGNGTGDDADLTSLAAKVGRARPDGGIPNDNPFFDGAGPNNDYVWARGFRNPYSFTFQPETEQLWVSVAGGLYEQVFVVGRGDHAGWNDYESNQPAGYLPPVLSWPNDTVANWEIAPDGAQRTGGVTTLTTLLPHRLRPGAKITISGVADASFNEDAYVASIPAPNLLTLVASGKPNAVSGGGVASTQAIGGAVVGGVFWDSTGAPPSHRGNFFVGDYRGGRIMRVVVDQTTVKSIEPWADTIGSYIDADVGPDGNLYYARYTGRVYRASYQFSSQQLVVSRLHSRVREGGRGAFAVRLATPPASAVGVAVDGSQNASALTIEQGAGVTFTTENWATPQVVRLLGAQDDDSVDDVAKLTVSTAGLNPVEVTIRVSDDDAAALLVSRASLALLEGATDAIEVSLSEPPTGNVDVTIDVTGDDDVDVSVTTLQFGPGNWSVPQSVEIQAREDDDSDDDDAQVELSATGYGSRGIAVVVQDNEAVAPSFVSQPPLSAVIDATYRYEVVLDGFPAPTLSLEHGPPGMELIGADALEWVPDQLGQAQVELAAQNGVNPPATQSFVVDVVADQPPDCILSAPVEGEVLSGELAEFFGDVEDDVGAVGARFSVDGAEVFHDVGDGGHYHFGAGHNLFDTTAYADGTHVLTMSGEDTSGQVCSVSVSVSIDNDGGAGGATGQAGGAGMPPDSGGASGTPEEPVRPGTAGAAEDPGGAGEGGAPLVPGVTEATNENEGCGCRAPRGADTSGSGTLLSLLWMVALRRRRARPVQA